MIKSNNLKIAIFSAECSPFIKVGGLGDVIGSLPIALKNLGLNVIIIIPYFKKIKINKKKKVSFKIKFNNKQEIVNIYQDKLPNSNLSIYFIDNRHYITSLPIYGNNSKKYLFFSFAAIEAMKQIKFQPDIIHGNDNQMGMISNLIKNFYNNKDDFFKKTKTIFTIHNLQYQGIRNSTILKYINNDFFKKFIRKNTLNFMEQAILTYDKITTVSPTYAKEILNPTYSYGLDKILKKRKNDLVGILNGIDENLFNPETDKFIKKNYNIKTLKNKIINKTYLQRIIGLPVNKKIPLIGMINRLVQQKGIDLITEKIIKLNSQFIILGTGDKKYEKYLIKLYKKYPTKLAVKIDFNLELAQQIYAGSDIFLMPSYFEPCGLGQMIAMKYGSVPIARDIGGLHDSIINYNSRSANCLKKANGFLFKDFSPDALHNTIEKALNIYYDYNKWILLQKNGMAQDFSWKKSAKKYLKLYKIALNK